MAKSGAWEPTPCRRGCLISPNTYIPWFPKFCAPSLLLSSPKPSFHSPDFLHTLTSVVHSFKKPAIYLLHRSSALYELFTLLNHFPNQKPQPKPPSKCNSPSSPLPSWPPLFPLDQPSMSLMSSLSPAAHRKSSMKQVISRS